MKHPSGDGDAVYQFVIKIVARVLVFIKCYRAQARGVVIFITLLAGFIPHLQVTFIDVVGRIYLSGLLAVKDRDNNHRIISLTPLSSAV